MNPDRLGVSQPEYKYPPSHNPYWKKLRTSEEFAGRAYTDNDTELYVGHWREHFPDAVSAGGNRSPERPLHVEIGCNAGHVVREWALRSPTHAYIGIDWKFKAICRAAEKAVARDIGNLLFFRAHAERIEFMFGPGEIDHLYLFFPDPWPKTSQSKNRFLTAGQFKKIARLIKTGGSFHIKTDHGEYFAAMEHAFNEVCGDWEVLERSNDLHRGHPNPRELTFPDVTLFERLFIKDGLPIHSLKLKRLGNGS
ncbi:MAG: hypothetical protein A2428_00655 [Bdellovibrionales bacterium RIFOXYC1_FULL_54_43]|nr:MAG: hypothetical protein A2428_00655 [Bdellovibrionales bacterium RIFOXYC1_FULL_54_43]OFZ81105.1 MAG: hypothetical protein A2603_06965 [Bdellovibrionales bacterium RIFOXYD1_FULL_55_31]